MKTEIIIDPCPKPRMTKSDKWKKRDCVLRYWAFKEELRTKAPREMFSQNEFGEICFYVPMPKSWSKKKKLSMDGMPHKQKPDIDNFLKGLLDALFQDDSKVWKIRGLEKRWAYNGSIVIRQLYNN